MKKREIEYEEDSKIVEKVFLKEGDDDINTNLQRPAAPKIDPKKDNIVFMQIDLDYSTDKPPTSMNMGSDDTTIVRMYGVTQDGNSVMAHIYNFRPYFYAKFRGKLIKVSYFNHISLWFRRSNSNRSRSWQIFFASTYWKAN